MKERMRRFTVLTAASGVLLQLAGCLPNLNNDFATFLGDLGREALAAFLF